ncbi:oxysterol-binding protein-related protein 6-like isoform X2 [Pomacea canaliculata]|uniref:oxysterol-binding protein-related protein 6-like isoform X2 n=1 Tax=Pomacea canaliculata TaxID=400727 RepID=UPI000D72D94D|nr:oxysterol-binding protein-related protein 6-like isoform X2 [Pomacea canaliculata]
MNSWGTRDKRDLEGSDDSLSQSSSHVEGHNSTLVSTPAPAPSTTTTASKSPKGRRKLRKSRREWEILEGLRDGQKCEDKPDKYQGYLMKRRKWPMKGWHKRFFVLEKGILTYAKSPSDIQKGKYHGMIDIGLAVITYKSGGFHMDIDAEEQVYHVKVKGKNAFEEWLTRLRHHRLYRQHEIAYGTKETPRLTEVTSPAEDAPLPPLASANLPELALKEHLKRDIIRQSSIKTSSQGRVAAWVLDTAGFEHCNKSLGEAQNQICQLHEILEQIRNLPIVTDPTIIERPASHCVESSERKKRGLGLRSSKHKDRKNSSSSIRDSDNNNSSSSNSLGLPMDRIHASASNPNLVHSTTTDSSASKSDCPSTAAHEIRIQEIRLRENFIGTAENVHKQLKGLQRMMFTERERLKRSLELDSSITSSHAANALRQALTESDISFQAQRQNQDFRSRLAKIHADSAMPDLPPVTITSPVTSPQIDRERVTLAQSISGESFSLSEYYDAEENIETISDSSSEPSDDEISSEISDEANDVAVSVTDEPGHVMCATGRRSKLPVPRPQMPDISLWNLLYRNIGKDLTKISMPVTLNEPLSMLQRLCEELEYSELLDKAADYDDPYERMIYIAAFAVSSYASSYYREGHKPFNPILGETFECIREDKGWRFMAEQVSHHPPISACYCDSRNFRFWQDVRIKTKFWGKSMEIQPLGHVHVVLPKYRDHYKWNKVTTCIHNLLGGQRWVDQYGEMTITNGNIVCKLTFTKGANSYSSKRYEVYGSIMSSDGKIVHNLFGKWNEALFCGHATSARCIWRPGAMPADHELYYGFTRFAIELNELDMEQARFLPPTDSRFRPDQRLMEEGKIQEAEIEKNRLENLQRERRKKAEEMGHDQQSRWFKKTMQDGKEMYEFTGKYWEARKDPGFTKMSFVKIF